MSANWSITLTAIISIGTILSYSSARAIDAVEVCEQLPSNEIKCPADPHSKGKLVRVHHVDSASASALITKPQTPIEQIAEGVGLKTVSPTKITKRPTNQIRLLFRQDFADASLIANPSPNLKATGGSFSYSDDSVKKNLAWALQGAVIGAYNFFCS